MRGTVWLGPDRLDRRNGVMWPEAFSPNWVDHAQAFTKETVLATGVDEHLWLVEIQEPAKEIAFGVEGTAQLIGEVGAWSRGAAGELRLQLFGQLKSSLARMLAAVQEGGRPDAFSRDTVLDTVSVARKVAAARSPDDLGKAIPLVQELIPRMWPPEKKKGLLAKKKFDVSRPFELLRGAVESATSATDDGVKAMLVMDVLQGVNDQLRVMARLARGQMMFVAMLDASQAPDPESMERQMQEAQRVVRRVRDLDIPGSGPRSGQEGLAGYSSAMFMGSEPPPSTIGDASDADAVADGQEQLPPQVVEVTEWLAGRLGLT